MSTDACDDAAFALSAASVPSSRASSARLESCRLANCCSIAERRDADAPSRHAFSIFFCIAASRSSQERIQSSAEAALSAAPRARNDEEKSERTRSERIESSDAAMELRVCSIVSARWVVDILAWLWAAARKFLGCLRQVKFLSSREEEALLAQLAREVPAAIAPPTHPQFVAGDGR